MFLVDRRLCGYSARSRLSIMPKSWSENHGRVVTNASLHIENAEGIFLWWVISIGLWWNPVIYCCSSCFRCHPFPNKNPYRYPYSACSRYRQAIERDCWSNACWVGDFVQFDPHSGSEPSQQIVYRHRAVRYRETLLNISFRPSTSIQYRWRSGSTTASLPISPCSGTRSLISFQEIVMVLKP